MLIAATAPIACSVHVRDVVRFAAAGTHTQGYFIVLDGARVKPATAGTMRMVTRSGHVDVPFLSEGTLTVESPTLDAVGASLLDIDGTPCRPNGASTDDAPGDAARIRAATPRFDAGAEVPDDLPHCAHPFEPPHVLRAAQAKAPNSYAQGTVIVRVSLDAAGSVKATSVTTTDDVRLNSFAVEAAQRSTFSPAIVNCAPGAADVTFSVGFAYR
jgi:TonB family protein